MPDPDHFRLNAKQFNTFKDSWFELYRRGTFNMELWGSSRSCRTSIGLSWNSSPHWTS